MTNATAGGVVDRVGQGPQWRDDRQFADAAHAVGMAGIRELDHDGFQVGNVQRGRHPIVQERGVGHPAVGVVGVALGERPANALGDSALDLATSVRRKDCLTHVLDGRIAEDVHFSSFRVDGHIHDVRGERVAGKAWCRGRDSDGRLALANDQPRGLFEVDRMAVGGKPFASHLHRRLGHVPDIGQDVAHLPLKIAPRLNGGPACCERGAAAGGAPALGDRVGVGNPRVHPVRANAQRLGQLHRDGRAGAADIGRGLQQGYGAVPVQPSRGR